MGERKTLLEYFVLTRLKEGTCFARKELLTVLLLLRRIKASFQRQANPTPTHLHHAAINSRFAATADGSSSSRSSGGRSGSVLLRHDEQGGHPVAHEQGEESRVLPPGDAQLLEHVGVSGHEAEARPSAPKHA